MKEIVDKARLETRKGPQMRGLSDYLNENMKTLENSICESGKEPEKKISPRDVWKNEAEEFTPWLATVLDKLAECLGIRMEPVETESPVGNLNVDILAKEEGTDRNIIIENQLETTDHDHLGKIITYASGREAGICIWIVGGYDEEHRNAIKWLNTSMGDKCSFFLVVVEVEDCEKDHYNVTFEVVESPIGSHDKKVSPVNRPGVCDEEYIKRFYRLVYYKGR